MGNKCDCGGSRLDQVFNPYKKTQQLLTPSIASKHKSVVREIVDCEQSDFGVDFSTGEQNVELLKIYDVKELGIEHSFDEINIDDSASEEHSEDPKDGECNTGAVVEHFHADLLMRHSVYGELHNQGKVRGVWCFIQSSRNGSNPLCTYVSSPSRCPDYSSSTRIRDEARMNELLSKAKEQLLQEADGNSAAVEAKRQHRRSKTSGSISRNNNNKIKRRRSDSGESDNYKDNTAESNGYKDSDDINGKSNDANVDASVHEDDNVYGGAVRVYI